MPHMKSFKINPIELFLWILSALVIYVSSIACKYQRKKVQEEQELQYRYVNIEFDAEQKMLLNRYRNERKKKELQNAKIAKQIDDLRQECHGTKSSVDGLINYYYKKGPEYRRHLADMHEVNLFEIAMQLAQELSMQAALECKHKKLLAKYREEEGKKLQCERECKQLQTDINTLKDKCERLENDQRLCCICQANKARRAFLPCGHLCVCDSQECLEGLRDQCPICRGQHVGILKIY